ncbi:MAG: phosphoglucosamine mutase [Bacteroidota bacterium]
MTLIKSISGIRGTIGGKPGEGLSPVDTVKFVAGYGTYIKKSTPDGTGKIVVGRDARISGKMVDMLVSGTLMALGFDVVNAGLATTPTVELAVTWESADGGIILTASHNPAQWNALKLLNRKGEFLSSEEGKEVLEIAESGDFRFANIEKIGQFITTDRFNQLHIDQILKLPYVDKKAIRKANFTIAIDCVNSVGGVIIPGLLKALGVKEVIELYCEPNGRFPRNPEPLPENLEEISSLVKEKRADLGFVVDPDVDRLAIINEDGTMFGEEYTLVAVADYILSINPGNTVSNLSSSRALKDITVKRGGEYTASAVGEVNVVEMMKKTGAVIGGEGNGGVILPDLHYGRDALVGIALFLSQLARSGKKCSELRAGYPRYFISKNKIQLTPDLMLPELLKRVKEKYHAYPVNDVDGVRIDFDEGWVHLRGSNTEPIIRVYAESISNENADNLARRIMDDVTNLIK